MGADGGDRRGHGVEADGPRRRRVSDRPKVGGRPHANRRTPHYLVCNADESEPGTFKDRVLMEGDPFALVEAMTIAAFATGCAQGLHLHPRRVSARGRAPAARDRRVDASDAALLGVDFDIEIRRGAGAYICGEETAIFESIEGRRGEPRNKPPFPVHAGLFGKPTVVNNVETLANVPHIVLDGGAAFATRRHRAIDRHAAVLPVGQRPVSRASTKRRSASRCARSSRWPAASTPGRTLRAVLLGGAAGTFVRPDELDLKLTHEDTRAAGTTLGSGVVMVVDDTIDPRDLVLRIAAFFRDESCGQCVPCRVGTVRQEEALHRIVRGAPARRRARRSSRCSTRSAPP